MMAACEDIRVCWASVFAALQLRRDKAKRDFLRFRCSRTLSMLRSGSRKSRFRLSLRKCQSRAFVFILLSVLISACAGKPTIPGQPLDLKPVEYDELRGWENDRQSEALAALARSCDVMEKGQDVARGWTDVCRALKREVLTTDDSARKFFEAHFTPYAVRRPESGLFTGYYEPELNGAWKKGGKFQTPLWQRPGDLVTVDLGAFKPGLSGQKIAGKVVDKAIQPYDDRAAIAEGSLASGRAQPLLWLEDPVDAFFLEVQGSGRVHMPGGRIVRVVAVAQNGKEYVPIGRAFLANGEILKPLTMAKIRAWLKEHPDRAQEIMNQNPSVVFFRRVDNDVPRGTGGTILTAGRSLAVDTSYVPLGAPLWLDISSDPSGAVLLPRLVVAQDTGSAIKGPVRGDLYWGVGADAEARASGMQSRGTYYLLLPKN